jgi:tetratricopeptide (TPR) repeat protein
MADQTEPVKRRVAIKLIRAESGNSRSILARFEAERQAIALMDHPHIAKLLDAGTTDGQNTGRPFFVMELVNGQPLTEFCDERKLVIADRLRLFIQICSAVQHAHQKGIIHRDLKPTNILVEPRDDQPVPKVIDFGLAKAISGQPLTDQTLFTAFGMVAGTPLYMAPEQAKYRAIDVDSRADIYALGAILYELLTGTTPITRETFKETEPDEMLKLVREKEAVVPSSRISVTDDLATIAANRLTEPNKLSRFVRGELDWIVMKALAKERERRYETASAFARDIERFLNHEPVHAGPPSASYRLRKFVRRNRGLAVAASLVLVTLVAGIAGTTFGLLRANSRTRVAERRLTQIDKGVELFAELLKEVNPRNEEEDGPPLFQQLRERAEKAADQLEGESIGDPLAVAKLQTILGETLENLGNADKAIEVLTKARATRTRLLGADDPETLNTTHQLAIAYRSAGKFDQAVSLASDTFERRKVRLGHDDLETLLSMNVLANAYKAAGKLDEALFLHEETLRLRKATYGTEHPDTLISMHNLANAYEAAGKFDQAQSLRRELLKLKAKLGKGFPRVLRDRRNLANALEDVGRGRKASSLAEETLALTKERLGADHPETLACMDSLAEIYEGSGRFAEALVLFEEALVIKKATLGADHPTTLAGMKSLSEIYRLVGKRDQVLPLVTEALALTKKKLGDDHPDTLSCMKELAVALHYNGRLDQAVPIYEEILKRRTAKPGADHPDTLFSQCDLAGVNQLTGKIDQALPLLEQAAFCIESLRFQTKPAKWIVRQTVEAYQAAQEFHVAEAWQRKWLAVVEQQDGIKSRAYAHELASLGSILLPQKKYSDAEHVLRECLAFWMNYDPDYWYRFHASSLLGAALFGQGNHAEAETLMLDGYIGMKKRAPRVSRQEKKYISEALERLVQFYRETGKTEEARKWQGDMISQ